MKYVLFALPLLVSACAADAYHASTATPPAESVYAANRECAWKSVRVGEVNPGGAAGVAGGAVGGVFGGAIAGGIIGAADNPQLSRWDACMAQHGWDKN